MHLFQAEILPNSRNDPIINVLLRWDIEQKEQPEWVFI